MKFGKVRFMTKARHPKTPNIIFVLRFAKALLESLRIPLGRFDVVVCTGSNFSIPLTLLSWLRLVPVVNVESPIRLTKPSKTAWLLQHFVRFTALQWEEQRSIVKHGLVVGLIYPRTNETRHHGDFVLVACGTYGHAPLVRVLNETSLENVVLQYGVGDVSRVVERHPSWKVLATSENFHELLRDAGIVVTALSFTVIEAVAYGKPVVIVPNPEWTRTGSVEDARLLAGKVNAVLVTELTKDKLQKAVAEALKREVPVIESGTERLANIIMKM
jgi:UDP-N-acetylglucosamine:LPS N-acetylglucosamine transferase